MLVVLLSELHAVASSSVRRVEHSSGLLRLIRPTTVREVTAKEQDVSDIQRHRRPFVVSTPLFRNVTSLNEIDRHDM